jgi:hypothetical protein
VDAHQADGVVAEELKGLAAGVGDGEQAAAVVEDKVLSA